jgi:membrane protein DedA with SNARE-associated domain
MNGATGFLMEHGLLIIFVVALVNQVGLPIPASPWLLAAGALSRSGQLAFFGCVALAVFASLAAHVAWYEAGRRSGTRIMHLVCRVALEPDACVRKTRNIFARRGASALIIAHFVPGLVTVAQPLAGTLRMPRPIFVVYNLLGSLIWAGAYIGAGYVFSQELGRVARAASGFGWALLVVGVALVIAFIVWKLVRRRRILHELAQARITPEELRQRLQAGEELVVVDLRHEVEVENEPSTIPGVLHIPAEELAARHEEIPRAAEVILYCS